MQTRSKARGIIKRQAEEAAESKKCIVPWVRRSAKNVLLLGNDVLGLIVDALDSPAYLHLTSCNRELWAMRQKKEWFANAAVQRAQTLRRVLDLRKNVYLTGAAGTGKSWLLHKIVSLAEQKLNLRVVVTATTGLACVNLPNGRTLHSFSGLLKGTIRIETLIEQLETLRRADAENGRDATDPSRYRQWRDVDLLIIDEISMLGTSFIEKVDLVARYGRGQPHLPFGGVQVVFTGDHLQLPPVACRPGFESHIWKQLALHTVILTHIHRQRNDTSFSQFLQRVRKGVHTPTDLQTIDDCVVKTREFLKTWDRAPVKPTQIFSQHKDVKRVNLEEFDKLRTPITLVSACHDEIVRFVLVDDHGGRPRRSFRVVSSPSLAVCLAAIGKHVDFRSPETISFRHGAQYLLTANICTKLGQVNGARCVFDSGAETEQPPALVFPKNQSRLALSSLYRTGTYPVFGHPDIYLRRRQYSLRYGYANTIHGCQGMTLDAAMCQLDSSIRTPAMAYVAMSRVTSLAGLYIREFHPKSIKIHAGAKKFYEEEERKQTTMQHETPYKH